MTDSHVAGTIAALNDALAIIKRVTKPGAPWTAEDISAGGYEPSEVDRAIATILNGVVDGSLRPAQGQDEPVAVTDAMIDAGLAYYSEGGCMGLSTHERREVVSDIIAAALSPHPAPAVSLPEDVAGLDRLASHVEYLRGDHDQCNPWLADTIEALAADNARLTEERDEALGKAAMNEEWSVESELENTRLRREVVRLKAALLPFAEFAKASSFDRLPDETPMTQGSRLARKQVNAGDFKRARAALSPADSKEGE